MLMMPLMMTRVCENLKEVQGCHGVGNSCGFQRKNAIQKTKQKKKIEQNEIAFSFFFV